MRSHYNRRDWEREKRDLDQKWNHQPGYKGLNIAAGLVFAGIIAAGLLIELAEKAAIVFIGIGALVLVIFLVIIASASQYPDPDKLRGNGKRTPDLRESDEFTGQ